METLDNNIIIPILIGIGIIVLVLVVKKRNRVVDFTSGSDEDFLHHYSTASPGLLKKTGQKISSSMLALKEEVNEYDQILTKNNLFYNNLSKERRRIFLMRLYNFMKKTEFVPCEMNEITTEMKVLISSVAIQITFGMNNFLGRLVKRIKVYPDIYYSRLLDAQLKGHFNPIGEIHISYKHFLSSAKLSDDGIHLGLHELAHALHHCFTKTPEYSFFINDLIKKLSDHVKTKQEINDGNNTMGFLRGYASNNEFEFFAICIENFFERPQQLYEKLPMVYKHFSFLLNQNPLGIDFFAGENNVEKSSDVPLFVENVSFKWPILLLVLSLFLCLILYVLKSELVGFLYFLTGLQVFYLAIRLLTERKTIFYDKYIVIRRIASSSSKIILPISRIMYVSTYRKQAGNYSVFGVSFVYYNRKIKEAFDHISQSEMFITNIRNYCKERGIFYK